MNSLLFSTYTYESFSKVTKHLLPQITAHQLEALYVGSLYPELELYITICRKLDNDRYP